MNNNVGPLLFLLSISILVIGTTGTSPLLLTSLIKSNATEARAQARVDPALFLSVPSYSGFLTVDEEHNSNTFFWYFPVANKPLNETPWIIWLQGGPGASSLYGLFDEIGPFQYDKELKLRESSWTKHFSVVFIDNPIGAGYSFTDNDGYATSMDDYSRHLVSAVQQLAALFPELRAAPLYVAGESYAGRYVPALATALQHDNTAVQLKGIILGNPVLNRESIVNVTAVLYQWGLLDTQQVLAVKGLQDNYSIAVRNGDNKLAYKARDALLDAIYAFTSLPSNYNILAEDSNLKGFEAFLPRVKEAIHVGDREFHASYSEAHVKLIPDFLAEVDSKVEKLLENCSVLIYCGQLDVTAPCAGAAAARRGWRWSRAHLFLNASRVPWEHDGALAGYVKSGGGLTEVLVRGAGHLAPKDKPAQVAELVYSFINSHALPTPVNYTPILPVSLTHTTAPTREKATADAGTIVSIALNVVLILTLAIGVVFYYKLKKKSEDFYYSSIDNISDDIFLT